MAARLEVDIVFRNARAFSLLIEAAELCESLNEDLPWRDEPAEIKARLRELVDLVEVRGGNV